MAFFRCKLLIVLFVICFSRLSKNWRCYLYDIGWV